MRLICNGNDLAEAVSKAIKAVSTRTPNPVLEKIKLDAAQGTATFTATDGEITIVATIVADVSVEGSVLIPGRLFYDFTRKLTGERIELKVAGNKMVVYYADSVGELACADVDEFPETREFTDFQFFTIVKKEFKDLINKIAFSVCQDDARPILKGVLLEIEDGSVTGVALDGYRLAKCTKAIEGSSALMSVVVPARSLVEVSKLLEDNDDFVYVKRYRNMLRVDLGHTTITTVLLDGDFIPYKNLLPASFETEAIIPTEPLSDGLDRAVLLNRDEKTHPVCFELSERLLTLTSKSGIGNLNEKIPVKTTGADLTIAFNARYFIEMLRVCGCDTIRVRFNSAAQPCIALPGNTVDDFLYLILPVRLS